MKITDEQVQAWIDAKTENLINGRDVFIGRDVVVDLKSFWIEVDNALLDVDGVDSDFRFLQCRLKGEISEAQRERDLKIIKSVAERMLMPFSAKHYTLDSAEAEAKRLASICSGVFYVMECKGSQASINDGIPF